MNIAREVILDLLPAYLSGEASPATRTLVEEHMKEDAELAQRVRLLLADNLAKAVPPALPPELELRSLRRTQSLLGWQRWLFGLGIFFSAMLLSNEFSFEGGHFKEFHFLLRDYPAEFGICVVLGLACTQPNLVARLSSRHLVEVPTTMGGKGYRPSATASAAHKGETAISASGQPFLRQRMLWHLRDTLCHNSERIYAPQVLFLTCTRAITEEKMLASGKMVGFVPTKDYDKARAFYEGKLGCEFISLDQYALVMSVGGHKIRIAKVPNFTPLQGTILGWEVENIEAIVTWLRDRGVVLEKYPFVQDRELGIWTTPTSDKVAWFKDPDGNILSVSQHSGL